MVSSTPVYLAVDLKDNHVAYIYSLGLCEVNYRIKTTCPGVSYFNENIEQLEGLAPWWRTTSTQQWPEMPEQIRYEHVHDFCEDEPWCTYALKHPVSVTTSSLSGEDLQRFNPRYTTTKKLFIGCVVQKGDKEKMKAIEQRLKHCLELSTSVIPFSKVLEKCQELEKELILDRSSDKTLCQKINQQLLDSNIVEQEKIVQLTVEQCTMERNLRFLSWLQEIRGIKKLNMDNRIQLNDWLIEQMEVELHNLEFKTTREFSHYTYSIFGKFRPDFVFFKTTHDWIKAGIIMQAIEELQDVALFGATNKVKLDYAKNKNRILPQAFMDLIKVANNLLIDSLKVGKVVKCIVVYGLLISYNKEKCIPVKYYVNFSDNNFEIQVGQEEQFSTMFSLIVYIGLM